jgi:hypothetical protein
LLIDGTGRIGGVVDFELGYARQEIKVRATELSDRGVASHAAKWDWEALHLAEVFKALSGVGFIGELLLPGEPLGQ